MTESCHTPVTASISARGSRHLLIAGNPNSGKSTVFNLLTGMRQQVGNYPGVTVERKSGKLLGADKVEVIDLPGSYSLNPKSLDEQIAYEAIANHIPGEAPADLIVCVIDATNLERNLYLATQVLDMGIPTIVVLNMMDEVFAAGLEINIAALEAALGVPVVPMVATKSQGLDRLREALNREHGIPNPPQWLVDERLLSVVERLSEVLGKSRPDFSQQRRQAESLRVLVSDRLLATWKIEDPAFVRAVQAERARLDEDGFGYAQSEVVGRYLWLGKLAQVAISRKTKTPNERTFSDRIDAVVAHRVFGPVIFAGVLLLVFQSIFSWATPVMDLIETGMLQLGLLVRLLIPAGMLADLMVDGVIAGVGNVVVFLPQILLLFFFLNLMESTGYMARSAFIMDRVMRKVGLTGGAVMPMMSGFACAVPAIMATRTMDSQRDRLMTILVVPLMSCSARLPVYTLFIAAFIPDTKFFGPIGYQGLTMFSLYMLGTVTAFVAAGVLRRIFKGPDSSFMIELPPYRPPQWRLVFWRMYDRARVFVVSAGKIIFVFSIILWFGVSFPRQSPQEDFVNRRQALETEQASLRAGDVAGNAVQLVGVSDELRRLVDTQSALQMEHSIVGRLGRFIEPVMRPLGFDWKLSAGIISAFAAREVIIGALGTIYSVADADENSMALRDHLKTARDPRTGKPSYTPLVALSLLVFFVLALQCTSTLAIAKRELNSWSWPTFMWLYMTGLAYIAAFIVYQGGLALGFS